MFDDTSIETRIDDDIWMPPAPKRPAIPRADCAHFPYNGTDEQRANLEKLATFLEESPLVIVGDYKFLDDNSFGHNLFNMGLYWMSGECNTVGCALGWGAKAGIGDPKLIDSALYDNAFWPDYAHQTYGVGGRYAFEYTHPTYLWCFAGRWLHVDNTPGGAATRIRYMLEHGVPETFNGQMHGVTPLAYVH